MDKVGSSRQASARSASPTFDRGIEERLAEALKQVASLKLELARVRAAYAAVLAAHQAGASVTVPEHAKPAAGPRERPDDFDWETWARVTKARIRGEDVEATPA
ncbi:MAG TPA: hypothetical protein VF202_10000 [Trueperaceae bacterium]|jgi:hypothetical protein